MSVRAANDQDIAAIVSMGRKFWQLTPYAALPYSMPYCPDSAADTLRQCLSHGLLFVAQSGDEVIGFIGAIAAPMPLQRDILVAAEQFWWVEEGARGGVGRQLKLTLEQAARDAGVTVLAMSAFEQINIEAMAKMYQRAGYDATERTYTKVL